MYKVPRERTKERTRPFVNSLRFKPPLKTLFELRECVFRERRRIERVGKSYCVDELKRIERGAFSHKNSLKREEGVGCLSIRLFRPLVLKKASVKAGRKRAKTRTLDEKERMKKRGRKSTETESFIFPSKQRREKNNLYSYKRE